jgi:integrase
MARAHRKDRGLYVRTLKDGSTVWGVRIAVHHRMLRFSPFPTKSAARDFYEKAKTEQREGRFFPEKYHQKGPLVQTFIDRYIPTIHNKVTAKGETVFAAWWGDWYKGKSIQAVTAEDLEAARLALKKGQGSRYGKPRTLARVNRYTQWLSQIFAHPVNAQHLPMGRNPVSVLQKYPEKRPPRHAASPEQEQALIEQLEQETPGARDWITIAVLCGLRQAEQFNRLKSDVDTHLWAFVIPNAKHANQPKIAYIPPSAREAVQRQLQTPGPWLFPDTHNPQNTQNPFPIKRWYKTVYRRAVRKAELPKNFNWHSLRHTFASRMLLAGASTKTVAQAGGWSSERMVADVYGHLTNQHVIEAMERAATGSSTATNKTAHRKHARKSLK